MILTYLFLMCPLWFLLTGAATAAATWTAKFNPSVITNLEESDERIVYFTAPNKSDVGFDPKFVDVVPSDCQIADVVGNKTIYLNYSDVGEHERNLSFVLKGLFLGHASVKVKAVGGGEEKESEDSVDVSVIRKPRVIDRVFIISVAVLLGLNYVNMGCSLDLEVVKAVVKRPVGPAVGLISQYLFMPLMSFGIAHFIFTSPNMRLGLFTLGCSPGGGASNMWTYLLGGNLNLSITMTFLSNILAFATMPAWLFTLGSQIFESSNIKIPYANIVSSLVVLVFPVLIGLIIQRYLPRVTSICRRLLGPCCLFMILFIVIFGIFSNIFMFSLFTWRVALAGLVVPWLGYAFGALLAKMFRFSYEDIVAVSVETGVQNTGIAIVLLRFSLPQPDADLTSVIPVAAAIMMPVPLLLLLLIFRLNKWRKSKGKDSYEVCDTSGSNTPDSVKTVENAKVDANGTVEKH